MRHCLRNRTNTNFQVIGLTQSIIELTASRARGEHSTGKPPKQFWKGRCPSKRTYHLSSCPLFFKILCSSSIMCKIFPSPRHQNKLFPWTSTVLQMHKKLWINSKDRTKTACTTLQIMTIFNPSCQMWLSVIVCMNRQNIPSYIYASLHSKSP